VSDITRSEKRRFQVFLVNARQRWPVETYPKGPSGSNSSSNLAFASSLVSARLRIRIENGNPGYEQ
jgi:hypothetical protein